MSSGSDETAGGTFEQVSRGIGLLREYNMFFNIIYVLSYDHLPHARELFEFFCEIGTGSVSFNIDEEEGINTKSSFRSEESRQRCTKFVSKFLQMNNEAGSPLLLPIYLLIF